MTAVMSLSDRNTSHYRVSLSSRARILNKDRCILSAAKRQRHVSRLKRSTCHAVHNFAGVNALKLLFTCKSSDLGRLFLHCLRKTNTEECSFHLWVAHKLQFFVIDSSQGSVRARPLNETAASKTAISGVFVAISRQRYKIWSRLLITINRKLNSCCGLVTLAMTLNDLERPIRFQLTIFTDVTSFVYVSVSEDFHDKKIDRCLQI